MFNKVENKTAASAAQLAKCILLHIYFTYNCIAARAQKNLHLAYLTSWSSSIFGYKLRTD